MQDKTPNPWNDRPPWGIADTIQVLGYLAQMFFSAISFMLGLVAALVGLLQAGCTLVLMAPFVMIVLVGLALLFGGR